jgi:hypothetical protein
MAFSLVVALFVSANALLVALLLAEGRADRRDPTGEPSMGVDSTGDLDAAVGALSGKVDRLAESVQAIERSPVERDAQATARSDGAVLDRLAAIERLITESRDTRDELAAATLKEEREQRLRSEDGYLAADDLLAEKKFALAANAYLAFLEHHPDHADAHDLMAKACDAFLSASGQRFLA